MNRKALWGVLAIGLAMAIAPLAISLPGKGAAGQRMMNGFNPIMQPNQVKIAANYYDRVFVPLGRVTPVLSAKNVAKFQAYLKGFGGMQADAAKLVPMLAQALHMTRAQVQVSMATQLPAMSAMLKNLPAMQRDFGGLMTVCTRTSASSLRCRRAFAHYKPLVRTMQANVQNYRDVNSLPDFRLFTVFFEVPGCC